jgi:hypothetical protein
MLWNFGGSGGSGNPEDSVALEVGSDNRLGYFIFSGAEGLISNFAVTYLNRWVHIVATRSGNNLNVYLDGVDQNLTTTGSDTLQLAANTEYTIGARGTGALGNNSLNGCISNFKVYDVVLEPSEVQKLYRLGRTGRSMVISDTAVGIGKVPEAQLDVRGNLNVDGVIQSQSPAWSLSKNNVTSSISASVIIPWNVINSLRGVVYDASLGKVYIPITGYYLVGVFAMSNSNVTLGMRPYINGNYNVTLTRGFWPYQQATGGGHNHVNGSGIIYLTAGDDLSIHLQTGNIHSDTNAHNQFWGYFIG